MAEQRAGAEVRPSAEEVKRAIQERTPPASKAAALAVMFPVGGTLLVISGVTLAVTLLGLAVSTPLLLLFSPVLVPAALVIALAVAGFLTSGALGLAAVSALSWIVNRLRAGGGGPGGRDIGSSLHEQMEAVKRRMAEAAGQVGQKTREVGHSIESRARETAGRT